ncbi:MAG: hypothetical protein M0R47_18935 [Methylobacter sp.]|uniref:hypothetical protein n=1 Tax=Methylobacter sp. TaxID=2051955 RepID=UPI0025DBA5BD|nr:hypothetical protein [Methylobacter sp.]MCK9622597.1 hypothetical protein [Methylobacter sp.]
MIEELKSDTLLNMSKEWYELFKAAGCLPTCHCCGSPIPIGNDFKLSSVTKEQANSNAFKTTEPHDVMYCAKTSCNPDAQIGRMHERQLERNRIFRGGRSGCSIINGKIVAGL